MVPSATIRGAAMLMPESFTVKSRQQDNLSWMQRDIDEPVCAGGVLASR
jgi:hypothetical protein